MKIKKKELISNLEKFNFFNRDKELRLKFKEISKIIKESNISGTVNSLVKFFKLIMRDEKFKEISEIFRDINFSEAEDSDALDLFEVSYIDIFQDFEKKHDKINKDFEKKYYEQQNFKPKDGVEFKKKYEKIRNEKKAVEKCYDYKVMPIFLYWAISNISNEKNQLVEHIMRIVGKDKFDITEKDISYLKKSYCSPDGNIFLRDPDYAVSFEKSLNELKHKKANGKTSFNFCYGEILSKYELYKEYSLLDKQYDALNEEKFYDLVKEYEHVNKRYTQCQLFAFLKAIFDKTDLFFNKIIPTFCYWAKENLNSQYSEDAENILRAIDMNLYQRTFKENLTSYDNLIEINISNKNEVRDIWDRFHIEYCKKQVKNQRSGFMHHDVFKNIDLLITEAFSNKDSLSKFILELFILKVKGKFKTCYGVEKVFSSLEYSHPEKAASLEFINLVIERMDSQEGRHFSLLIKMPLFIIWCLPHITDKDSKNYENAKVLFDHCITQLELSGCKDYILGTAFNQEDDFMDLTATFDDEVPDTHDTLGCQDDMDDSI